MARYEVTSERYSEAGRHDLNPARSRPAVLLPHIAHSETRSRHNRTSTSKLNPKSPTRESSLFEACPALFARTCLKRNFHWPRTQPSSSVLFRQPPDSFILQSP